MTTPYHRPYTLLFDLILHTRLLDALDVCALGQCNKELRDACTAFWPKVAKSARAPPNYLAAVEAARQHLLRSTFRDVEMRLLSSATRKKLFDVGGKVFISPFVDVSEARPCVLCRQKTCHRHPLLKNTAMCAPCGNKTERAELWSPMVQYRLITENEARARFMLASNVNLKKSLPYIERPAGDGAFYAPRSASSVKAARAAARLAESGPQGKEEAKVCVFLLVDVACMVLEVHGGPRLLSERMRNLQEGPLGLRNRTTA